MSFSNAVKSEIASANSKKSHKRGFIQEAFIAYGSLSDPKKRYHLEFVCPNDDIADKIINVLKALEIIAKKTSRKGHTIVYIKDSEIISQFLRLVGANNALFALENSRIVKDVRQNVNRFVNCETANLAKSATASHRQIQDILFLRESGAMAKLPEPLIKIAEIRLQYPEDSMIELGQRLTPPIGKSGANHRLRKLSQIAEDIRTEKAANEPAFPRSVV